MLDEFKRLCREEPEFFALSALFGIITLSAIVLCVNILMRANIFK